VLKSRHEHPIGVIFRPPLKLNDQVKPYPTALTGITMVDIQCPHCDDDVEVSDGKYGLLDCPHCDEEFELEHDEELGGNHSLFKPSRPVQILGIISILILFGIVLLSLILFSGDNHEETWSLLFLWVVFLKLLGPLVGITLFVYLLGLISRLYSRYKQSNN